MTNEKSSSPFVDNINGVTKYYSKKESRIGYSLLLKGTKHFGYYSKGDKPWAFDAAMRRMEEKLAETLDLPRGSIVLDAGCGVGDVATYLAAKHGLQVTGIDILDFNLAEAKRRAEAKGLSNLVDFRRMSYSELDLPDNSFDAVYTMETLVHAVDAERVLKEFYRILRPGGKLALFEYSRDPDSLMPSKVAQTLHSINARAAMPSFDRFEHGVLERFLKKVGFSNIEVTDISTHMWPMLQAFMLLAVIPYSAFRLMGRLDKYVNVESAVESWRYHQHWRYNIYSAEK
jgi:sterol 24-C-methyltransferase